MSTVITLLIQSVILGCIYSLVALAFNLVFATTKIVNLAQGDFVAYGGVLYAVGITSFHLSQIFALFLSLIGVMLIAYITIRAFVIPVLPGVLSKFTSEADNLRWVLATLGVSVALEAIGSFIAPQGPLAAQPWLSGTLLVNGIQIPKFDFIVVAVTVALVIGTFMFLMRTDLGRLLRTMSADRYVVAILGHSVNRMITVTFVGAGALSAVAGILIAPILHQANPETGFILVLYGFAAAVVGGFGDIRGSLLGGFIIAAVQLFGSTYWNAGLYDILPMLILILVLMVKPGGIFSSPLVERV